MSLQLTTRACCLTCVLSHTQLVFDNQLSSVRQGSERALFTESPTPHTVVRRYASLSASMLLLLAAYDTDAPGGYLTSHLVRSACLRAMPDMTLMPQSYGAGPLRVCLNEAPLK